MVKVWKDASCIFETQLPTKEEYRKLMEGIPNFDKSAGAKKIYQRKEYVIYSVQNGFIIHNTRRKFENAHTHLKGFIMAKTLIDCAIKKKLPKTRNHYLLRSLIRISVDKKYINQIEELIEVRENKQIQKYTVK